MKKLFLAVVVILTALMPINGLVGAAKRKDVDYQRNAYNNIMFYDDTDCETPTPGKTCSTVSGSDITWIGDSLTVLRNLGPGAEKVLNEKFPGVDYGSSFGDANSYVQSGRFVSDDDSNLPSGFTILERIISEGKLRSCLVFALGGNGGYVDLFGNDLGYVDKLMNLVGSDTKVVILTSKMISPHYYANDISDFYPNSNELLKQKAEEYSNLTIGDWASEVKDEYYVYDGVHYNETGQDAYFDFIKSVLPSGGCSAGLLSGDNIEEKIWNYFVRAKIPGVSDNPAVISGIMGNFYVESGYNPFMYKCNFGECGSMLWAFLDSLGGNEIRQKVNSALGGKDYWKFYGWWGGIDSYPSSLYADAQLSDANVPVDDIEIGIGAQLDELTKSTTWNWFVEGLDEVDNTTGSEGAKSYAELFMGIVENCYGDVNGESQPIDDQKVQAYVTDRWMYHSIYQGAKIRRESAVAIYDRLSSGAKSTPSGTDTGFSSTETLSGTNNVKFDATDKEIKDLLLFSLWKAKSQDRDYSEILSEILDDFDKSGEGEKGVASSLIKFVEESDKFKYRESYDSFKKDFLKIIKEIKIESGQLEDAEKIIKNGLRPTTEARVQTTNGLKKDANECKDGSKKGKGAERIAETAALMAWPVQSWQTGADDFSSDKIAKCYNDFDSDQPKGWISYTYNQTCRNTPRSLYKQAYAAENRLDCGVFSLSVLKQLDLIDSTTVGRGQPGAGGYFRSHTDEWKEIKVDSESDLKPGDVLWNSGHIMIYVGEKYGGDFGIVAHASVGCVGGCQLPGEGGRVGQISGYNELYEFTGFRYIGDKLGGGDFGEGGDAIANAAEYLAWPNTIGGQANADAGILTDEYRQAKDEWWGPNDGVYWNGGDDNDVSCARFTSLSILVSGADPGFQAAPPPSRANIRGVGDNPDSGLEGYLRSSSNWEDVTNEKDYKRGDVFIRSGVGKWHVYIYLGGGLIAEGANRNEGKNMAGVVRRQTDTIGYNVYRLKE